MKPLPTDAELAKALELLTARDARFLKRDEKESVAEKIAQALAEARCLALEEAARVAENNIRSWCRPTLLAVASGIRELKGAQ